MVKKGIANYGISKQIVGIDQYMHCHLLESGTGRYPQMHGVYRITFIIIILKRVSQFHTSNSFSSAQSIILIIKPHIHSRPSIHHIVLQSIAMSNVRIDIRTFQLLPTFHLSRPFPGSQHPLRPVPPREQFKLLLQGPKCRLP